MLLADFYILYNGHHMFFNQRIKFLNIFIDNLSHSEALDKIESFIKNDIHNVVIPTNVDCLVKLQKDNDLLCSYESADVVLADGVPIIWGSKLLGTPLKEKVSGSDIFPKLCERASQKKYSIFFLGGIKGIGEKASIKLKLDYPDLDIVGTYSPPFGFEYDSHENKRIIELINKNSPDILCVFLGVPKQEKWLYQYRDQLDVKVSICLGASLDFIAGKVKRAPVWMQKNGLEWLFRIFQEPKRMFKRYFIDDFVFFPLFIKFFILKRLLNR